MFKTFDSMLSSSVLRNLVIVFVSAILYFSLQCWEIVATAALQDDRAADDDVRLEGETDDEDLWETDQVWKETDLDQDPTSAEIPDQNKEPTEPEKTESREEPMADEKTDKPEVEASSGSRVSWILLRIAQESIYVNIYTYM